MTNIRRMMMGAGVVGEPTGDRSLFAWGYNAYGQHGNDSTTNTSSPVLVGAAGEQAWTSVCAGQAAAAIKSNGALWGWGYNYAGRLGDGTHTSQSSPIQIGSLTDWSKVSESAATTMFAIKTDGTLWGWGENSHGELGVGDLTDRSSPVQIGALTNWASISGGTKATYAIKTDGTMWAWGGGFGADRGGLAQGNNTAYSSPVQIGGLTTWAMVAHGGRYGAHAIKTDGTMWGWGYSTSYAPVVGDSTNTQRSSPVQIGALTTWTRVSNCGYANRQAVKTDGTLWSWGDGGNGYHPRGDQTDHNSPVQVGSLTNWSKPFGGGEYATGLHLKTDGTLWAWGRASSGNHGTGSNTTISSPAQVGSLTTWTDPTISVGGDGYALALVVPA